MTYAEQLKDSRWRERRDQIVERDGGRCRQCGEDEKPLIVHHSYYQNGRMAWEYPDDALHTLCLEPCHDLRAQEERELMKSVHLLSINEMYEFGKLIRIALEMGESPVEILKAGISGIQNMQWTHTIQCGAETISIK